MKGAMLAMMKFILDLVRKEEERAVQDGGALVHTPSNMNFAVTDGTVVIATRYRDSIYSHPPSLYFSEANQLRLHKKPNEVDDGVEINWKFPAAEDKVESVVVASEPLTRDPKNWMLVPRNHLLIVTAHQRTIIEPIDIELSDQGDQPEMDEEQMLRAELLEENRAGEWEQFARREAMTGEEEVREEVLKDPRNVMKVPKSMTSDEDQRKIKDTLKEQAPDFASSLSVLKRRHSMANHIQFPFIEDEAALAGIGRRSSAAAAIETPKPHEAEPHEAKPHKTGEKKQKKKRAKDHERLPEPPKPPIATLITAKPKTEAGPSPTGPSNDNSIRINLDVTKGFLMFLLVNILCALTWASYC